MIALAGAAALPAAALALPAISGGDGVVISPSKQSPDFTISSADPGLSWQVKDGSNSMVDFGFGGSVDVSTSLPDGDYTLEATDADGTVPRSFTIDATPPGAPSVITPAEGAEYTVGQSVALSYFCSAGATCSPANGSAVDTSSPGGKTLTVTATDAAGNETSVDVHYTVSSPPVDSTPPSGGSLSVPAATNSATIGVTAGAASDPSSPITYALAQGNTPPSAGEYGAPGVLPTSFTLAGPDGTKVVRLWARDAAGNAGDVAADTVVLDRGGPGIGITTPADGATYQVGTSKIANYSCADGVSGLASCTGTVPDGAAIDTSTPGPKSFTVTATDNAGNSSSETVTYTVGDDIDPTVTVESPKAQKYEVNTLHLASFSCDDNAPGAVTCAGTAPNGNPIDTSSLGEKVFTVQATDAAGNTTTKHVTFQVVDTHDPTPPGLVSPPDSTVTNQMRPRLNWTGASDPGENGVPGSGIAGYEVVLDGKLVATVDADTTSWTPDADLDKGSHVWRVRALDEAGNVALSELFDFRVDPNATPAPTLTTTPPAATNDNTPSFAWTGADGAQAYHWSLRQGTSTVDEGLLGAGSPAIDLGPMPDGDYVFAVTQRTNGNHGTAAAHAFTVDTVAPGPLALVVRPVAVSDDATPLFAWAGGEPDARYLWQLSGPGGVIVQGPVTTPLNAALLNVAPGSYVFQVRQMDAAGNPGPLTIPEPFTVVGGPPPPPPPPGGGTPNEPTTPAPTVKKPTKTVKQAAPTTRNARAMTPKAGARIVSVRPVLRWKARKGASLYNVQVFRLKGTKLTKVVTAFPRGTTYRVPKGKLAAGFRYVWRVWPFVDQRFPAQPLGVSYFDVKQTAKSLARSRLLAPTGTSVPAGKAMAVRWRAKSGSAAYKVQVLRGSTVAFEMTASERTAVVPASALAAKGTIRLRIMSGVGASDTAFAKTAWAQADLRVR